MSKQTVKDLALKNGFKLKQQPNGELELNPYVYDFADELVKDQQQTIESLKAQLAQYQSDDYVLVPKKELSIWYFNEAEGYWLEEADNFLCEIEPGQVFTVQRQHNFSLPEVYVARPWSEVEQWADHYKEYATKEEAEKVAQHCKAMIEAQEQGND